MNSTVGSAFSSETRANLPSNRPLPWETGGESCYVQSGRQALRLLSRVLWEDGYRRLVLPGYLCESMIRPFETHSWTTFYCPLTDGLRPNPQAYDELLIDNPRETVVVLAEYFGRVPTSETQGGIDRWTGLGVAVVEDRTHSLLDDYRSRASYAFGSLRKLVPVGDGCFVQGVRPTPTLARQSLDPSASSWKAMDLKLTEHETDRDAAHRQYRAAEAEFEEAMEPAPISSRSRRTLSHLDVAAMRAARKANFEALRELIPEANVVNDDCVDSTPAFFVMRVANPDAWQELMADEGVFCPIHWQRPQSVPAEIAWRADLISIPIDHRYGRSDMERVAHAVKKVASRLG